MVWLQQVQTQPDPSACRSRNEASVSWAYIGVLSLNADVFVNLGSFLDSEFSKITPYETVLVLTLSFLREQVCDTGV